MPTNVLRLVDQVDKASARREREVTRALQGYMQRAHKRLKREVQVAYQAALADTQGSSRVFREARARMVLEQLETAMRAFDLSAQPTGVPDMMREAFVQQRQEGGQHVARVLEQVGDADVAANVVMVNVTAAEMQVANAQRRLARYSREAVDRVNAAIVDGLVRGDGVRQVQREIAKAIVAPNTLKPGQRIPAGGHGGLAFRAETIARTELISALEDAREDSMAEAGVDLALWIATDDERTCEYCAARDGNVYKLSDIVLPAHPRCRCTTSPVKREWIDEGALDVAAIRKHQEDTDEAFAAAHAEDGKGYARGPSPFERAAGMDAKPKAVWTPRSGWAA